MSYITSLWHLPYLLLELVLTPTFSLIPSLPAFVTCLKTYLPASILTDYGTL